MSCHLKILLDSQNCLDDEFEQQVKLGDVLHELIGLGDAPLDLDGIKELIEKLSVNDSPIGKEAIKIITEEKMSVVDLLACLPSEEVEIDLDLDGTI